MKSLGYHDAVPPTMMTRGQAVEMLGHRPAETDALLAGLREAGRRRLCVGRTAPLYWREDVERIAAGQAEGDRVSAHQAARVLGVRTPCGAASVLRKAGVKRAGTLKTAKSGYVAAYRRTDVERVAAERASPAAAEAAAQARRDAATLAACVQTSTLRYGEDDEPPVPSVMYGLLDYFDARELLRRRALMPDWRPRMAG